jgi:hypothetical protein
MRINFDDVVDQFVEAELGASISGFASLIIARIFISEDPMLESRNTDSLNHPWFSSFHT